MFGSEVVAADTAQEGEPKKGCMSSLDKKRFMLCDDCHIAICNECCLACCRGDTQIFLQCNFYSFIVKRWSEAVAAWLITLLVMNVKGII